MTVVVAFVTVVTTVEKALLVTVLVKVDLLPVATHEQNPVKRLQAILRMPICRSAKEREMI